MVNTFVKVGIYDDNSLSYNHKHFCDIINFILVICFCDFYFLLLCNQVYFYIFVKWI